ncbi:MFS transporter [Sungkyunkwania multivorans]|uniref:MFS transporter n=1 Tax=Sungkyunkwania multivorans TaxID=1173618 RepID=A0ABW3CV10_9FLAO
MSETPRVKQSFYIILLLILAGEAVFILPFVLARVFRPTFLDVFSFNNVELGYCFSIYGVVALMSYLFGGVLADRFQPKNLMATALLLTAAGGLVMASFPSYLTMKILYGYWGFTTIFLFWAAMIKATRTWGGVAQQGKAFGFLDGGRGLVAACFGLLGVLVFSFFINVDLEQATLVLRKQAFRYVVLTTTVIVALVGVLVFFFLKTDTDEEMPDVPKSEHSLERIKLVMKIPSVLLLTIIILCGYVGYKVTDVFSLYAKEVMLYDEVDSAKVGTFLLYIRPVVGVLIGFLADRTKASVWLIIGFTTMLLGGIFFASGILAPSMNMLFLLSIFTAATGIYAIRVLYFAAMHEGKIPLALTGTAVGLMSLIGYTPDIFMGPAIGYLLDNSPGEVGHQHVFVLLSVFSVIGLLASIIFYRLALKKKLQSG